MKKLLYFLCVLSISVALYGMNEQVKAKDDFTTVLLVKNLEKQGVIKLSALQWLFERALVYARGMSQGAQAIRELVKQVMNNQENVLLFSGDKDDHHYDLPNDTVAIIRPDGIRFRSGGITTQVLSFKGFNKKINCDNWAEKERKRLLRYVPLSYQT